jgi:hypothetical protein
VIIVALAPPGIILNPMPNVDVYHDLVPLTCRYKS